MHAKELPNQDREQVPISYETQGDTRIICLDKYGSGAISPIKGKEREQA